MSKSITKAQLYRHLDQHPGATVKEVAFQFELSREYAWANLREAEQAGLIRAERDRKSTGSPMSYFVV
jgi:DNA-binding MarR family transcriptional regulator